MAVKKTKMDISTAVEFTENAIKSGKSGFFIYTEFGKIAIESVQSNDPLSSVIQCPWQDAPATDWAKKRSDKQADYYVMINKVNNSFSVHMYTIEAMLRCVLSKCTGTDVEPEIIDAAVCEYLRLYENNTLTINYIEKQFTKVHYNLITRNNPIVASVTRDWLQRRMNDCDRVLIMSRKVLKKYAAKNHTEFSDEFTEILWGLTLYALGSEPDVSDRVPKAITDSEYEVQYYINGNN